MPKATDIIRINQEATDNTSVGAFPALRVELREALGGLLARRKNAVARIMKAAEAETEFYENLAEAAEQQLDEAQEWHHKSGQ